MSIVEKHIKLVAASVLSGNLTDEKAEQINHRASKCGACAYPVAIDTLKLNKEVRIPIYKCGACNCKKTLDLKTSLKDDVCEEGNWKM